MIFLMLAADFIIMYLATEPRMAECAYTGDGGGGAPGGGTGGPPAPAGARSGGVAPGRGRLPGPRNLRFRPV